jgi:hypothetical protein
MSYHRGSVIWQRAGLDIHWRNFGRLRQIICARDARHGITSPRFQEQGLGHTDERLRHHRTSGGAWTPLRPRAVVGVTALEWKYQAN